MTRAVPEKKIFMTGLTGLIGRWTAARLTGEGHQVVALMRNTAQRGDEIREWIAAHGGDVSHLHLIEGDLEIPGFGFNDIDRARLQGMTHIYHFGALMDWSADRTRMYRINVAATKELLAMAENTADFECFVHISGYLITADAFWRAHGVSRDDLVTSERRAKKFFRRFAHETSAYEASKTEADIVVRRARKAGLPVAIINPATVIGHSKTGEAHQLFVIEGLIRGLDNGSLAAIPGKADDWLPFVSIDYVAEFLARVPLQSMAVGEDFTLLHQGTPSLVETLSIIASELGRKAPQRFVPLWLLRPLLKAGLDRLTGTPADALGFVNAFRFDTSATERAAVAIGLEPSDIKQALRLSVRNFANLDRQAA